MMSYVIKNVPLPFSSQEIMLPAGAQTLSVSYDQETHTLFLCCIGRNGVRPCWRQFEILKTDQPVEKAPRGEYVGTCGEYHVFVSRPEEEVEL